MTQRDADQLQEWVDGFTMEQFKAFWRWVTLAYMDRCRRWPDERRATADPQPAPTTTGRSEG